MRIPTKLAGLCAAALACALPLNAKAARDVLLIDDDCIVNVLNRTVQADARGNFELFDLPSTMGKVRARNLCAR